MFTFGAPEHKPALTPQPGKLRAVGLRGWPDLRCGGRMEPPVIEPGSPEVNYVDGDTGGLARFAAACRAASARLDAWADRVAAAAAGRLASDPAFRTAVEAGRPAYIRVRRPCQCPCREAHPSDVGVCDDDAVITRRLASGRYGAVDVALCAPCAVAQGVAELAP